MPAGCGTVGDSSGLGRRGRDRDVQDRGVQDRGVKDRDVKDRDVKDGTGAPRHRDQPRGGQLSVQLDRGHPHTNHADNGHAQLPLQLGIAHWALSPRTLPAQARRHRQASQLRPAQHPERRHQHTRERPRRLAPQHRSSHRAERSLLRPRGPPARYRPRHPPSPRAQPLSGAALQVPQSPSRPPGVHHGPPRRLTRPGPRRPRPMPSRGVHQARPRRRLCPAPRSNRPTASVRMPDALKGPRPRWRPAGPQQRLLRQRRPLHLHLFQHGPQGSQTARSRVAQDKAGGGAEGGPQGEARSGPTGCSPLGDSQRASKHQARRHRPRLHSHTLCAACSASPRPPDCSSSVRWMPRPRGLRDRRHRPVLKCRPLG